MKVLLVNLPWQVQGIWGVRAGSRWPHIKDASEDCYLPFPFFLAYAASLLQKNAIDITIIDAIAEQLSEDKFIEKIARLDFDILVTETSTPSIRNDLNILQKIASHNIPIVLCGPHSEIYQPEFLEKYSFIKYILYGEYELTLLELVKNLKDNKDLSRVNGLIWRRGCEVIKNPARSLFDINILPWPHRETLPIEKYFDLPGNIPYPSVQMLASRGCPFGCNFCLWPQVLYQGNRYRTRNIDDVINEMEHLIKNKGFKSVYFDDDTFNIDKQRMLSFSQAIKDRGLEKTPWAIMARADLMDEEILTAMKSAGLKAVKYGVESSNQSLIKNYSKNMDLKRTTRMIKMTKDLGIKVHLTFCFGVSGENRETIQRSIEYAARLEPNSVQFSLLTPFPGTALFEELDKQGRILTKDWSKYDGHHCCVFKPDNLSPRELEEAKAEGYEVWAEHTRKRMGLHKKIDKFFIYYKYGGIRFALRKIIKFVVYKINKYSNEKKIIKKLKTIFGYKIKVVYGEIKISDPVAFYRKIKDYYLDILGIFSCKFAFKGPFRVQIDLTNKCNNNCIACWCNSPLLTEKRNDGQSLSFEKVIELIDTLKKIGTREIYLAGGGEPFMYPKILEVIRYIKKKGFVCYVNTNATLLDEQIIYELVRLKVDYLITSLWAGTRQIYKIMHPNKNEIHFYHIEQMLKFLAKIKSRLPRVVINNVISNLNYKDIYNMVNFALEVQADAIDFALVDTIPGRTDTLLLNAEQRLELSGAIENISQNMEIRKRIEIMGLMKIINRLRNPFSEEGHYDKGIIDNLPCYTGWIFSRILANGDVNACLKAHRYPVGNIYNESFRSIWNSSQQQLFRAKTRVANKDDIFFGLIGNDPNAKIGCYRGCDDFEKNLKMHKKLGMLTNLEKKILKKFAKLLKLTKKIIFCHR